MAHGLFENLLGSETEVGIAKQASADKLNTAVYDVREKLGGFLFQASSLEDFRDRVAMMKNDQSLFKVIEASGLHPATGIVRRIAGKNSILENEFRQKLALSADGGAGDFGPSEGDPSVGGAGLPGAASTTGGTPMGSAPTSPSGVPDPTGGLLNNTITGRSRRADFEGVQDIDSTFSKEDQGKELTPKDDWKGYLNSVDQDAPSKVKRNFASKQAWNVYRAWCATNGKSAARLSSLDAYATNLSDAQYLKLANTIQACNDTDWGSDHHPKTPNTKLKKTDKVANGVAPKWVDDQAYDQSHPEYQGEGWQHSIDKTRAYMDPTGERRKHEALRRYVAWCDRNGYSKVAKSTIDYYVSRVAADGKHHYTPGMVSDFGESNETLNTGDGGVRPYLDSDIGPNSGYHSDIIGDERNIMQRDRGFKNPPPSGRHRAEAARLRKHLYAQVATTLRWAKKQGAWGQKPGEYDLSPEHLQNRHVDIPGIHRNPKENPDFWNDDRGDFGPGDGEGGHTVVSRRRTAAPDYLQKADDALTQLLNQKAQEFQETISPLQMALKTVQEAEQLQQQQNPLNVLPPAGTVNVMPGGGQPSTADQVGMPDPNAQDTSGLAALLSGVGGTAPNDAPMGGGQGAPPPAAGDQGAIPPEMDPSQGQQLAANRKRGGRPKARSRSAAGVGEQFDSWRSRKTQQGDLLRGGDPDYEQFANETGVGERALNKLKKRNQTPDFAPINRPELQGVTVGKRKRAYYDDDGYGGDRTDDFHTYNDRGEYKHPGQDKGWSHKYDREQSGPYTGEHYSKGSAQVHGGPGPDGDKYHLHTPHGKSGPYEHPEHAMKAAEPYLAQEQEIKGGQGVLAGRRAPKKKARGVARPQRRPQAMRKGAPFAGYEDFEQCEDENSDKRSPGGYCGEIQRRVEKGSARVPNLRNHGGETGQKVRRLPGRSTGGFVSQLRQAGRAASGENGAVAQELRRLSKQQDALGSDGPQNSGQARSGGNSSDQGWTSAARGVHQAHLLAKEAQSDRLARWLVRGLWDLGPEASVGEPSGQFAWLRQSSTEIRAAVFSRSQVHAAAEALRLALSELPDAVRVRDRQEIVADLESRFADAGLIKHRTEDKKQGRRKRSAPVDLDTGKHSIADPDDPHETIMNPVSPYTGGSMFEDAPDLTPRAARRKEAWPKSKKKRPQQQQQQEPAEPDTSGPLGGHQVVPHASGEGYAVQHPGGGFLTSPWHVDKPTREPQEAHNFNDINEAVGATMGQWPQSSPPGPHYLQGEEHTFGWHDNSWKPEFPKPQHSNVSNLEAQGYKWEPVGGRWLEPQQQQAPELPPQRALPPGRSSQPNMQPGQQEKQRAMASRRRGQRKQSWSGWGPAQFPKTRKVAGWDWDDHLNAYIANAPRRFQCSCGNEHETPMGYQRCKCGKAWHSYVIGTGGNNKEAAAEKFLMREIAVRPDVIVASRNRRGNYEDMPDENPSIVGRPADADYHLDRGNTNAAWALHKEKQHGKPLSQFTDDDWAIAGNPPKRKAVQLVDPRTGNIHRLIDPGELDEGEDPGHSTFKQPPADWAKRGDGAKWTKSPIG